MEPVDKKRPPIGEEEYAKLKEIAEYNARYYARKLPVSYEELVQESWVHVIVARNNFYALPVERQVNYGGWIDFQTGLRVSCYCWAALCPVSIPKKKVPQKLRDGIKTVPTDKMDLSKVFAGDLITKIDLAAVFREVEHRYPLALPVLQQEQAAEDIARANDVTVTQVKKECTEARRMIKAKLQHLYGEKRTG